MEKHLATPGPWKITHNHFTVDIDNDALHSAGMNIATCWRINATQDVREDPERDANALLIAAAPELLDACKAMLEFAKSFDMGGDWYQGNYPAVKKAYAAIKKAEGE